MVHLSREFFIIKEFNSFLEPNSSDLSDPNKGVLKVVNIKIDEPLCHYVYVDIGHIHCVIRIYHVKGPGVYGVLDRKGFDFRIGREDTVFKCW